MKLLLWLLSVCPHTHRGRWCRDPETGEDYQPCIDCGQRLRTKIQLLRTLALPEKVTPTGIQHSTGRHPVHSRGKDRAIEWPLVR